MRTDDTEASWHLYGSLLAVLREGSLSGAARAMRVAQPTVRRHIEELEERLGAVLFTRGTNGLVPTELALATLPYAESIASMVRALGRAVSERKGSARGTVRVTCSEMVGVEVLPRILTELRRETPELHIELVATNRSEDMLRRDADVAVRMFEPTQVGLVRKRVGRVELGLFAHASYLRRHRAPKTIAELSDGHSLIGADRSPVLIDALASVGAKLSPKDFCFRTDSDVVHLAAIRAGVGIGLCQVPLSRRTVPLVRVLPDVTLHLDVWVVMHEDLRTSTRIRSVFDFLSRALEKYCEGR